jgi:kynurenine formamidase
MPATRSNRCALPGLVSIALACAACGTSPSPAPAPLPWPGTLVDLSHPYNAQTLFWPTAERFTLKTVSDGTTPGGYYYAANWFSMEEHGGTHIDAPRHFAAGQWTVDEIPLNRLAGPAAVVDVSARVAENADYQVTAEDLQAWEKTHGSFAEGSLVLLRTGFSARWPDASMYLGTADRGPEAVANLHFPGLHPDAARWLVENRRIHAVGIDTASIDFGQSTTFESHRALFAANIPAFENLTQLDRLPPTGAIVLALPMKIGSGSGAPLRAVGILPSTR